MSIIFFITVFSLVWLSWKLISLWNLSRRTNMKGLSLISCICDSKSMLTKALNLVSRERPSGFMYSWQGSKLVIMAVDPKSAKFVLKSPNFEKFDTFTIAPKYVGENFGVHLLITNGDVWKRHRSFVNSGFTNSAYQEYFPIFLEMTEKALSKMESKIDDDINLRPWLSNFTLDLLGNSIFHYDFGRMDGKNSEIYSSYSNLVERFNTPIGILLLLFPWLEKLPLPQISRLYQSTDHIKDFFLQIIKERQQDGKKKNDVLDNLLSSQNKEEGLSQLELLSNIFVFFLAGHETTATALTWACVNLARHQDIQEKLYKEIEETIGNRPPTFEDLSKLHYLDCFISEVLRLGSPVTFIGSRVAINDVVYNDQIIPKGSLIGLFHQAIQLNPDHWPNPEIFDPDRFLPENKKGRNHYAYLPFSLGPRQCIGNIFSLIEQRLFITCLLQKFRVLPPKNIPLRSQNDIIAFGKSEPVYVLLKLR